MDCGDDHIEYAHLDISRGSNASLFVLLCLFLVSCFAVSLGCGYPGCLRSRTSIFQKHRWVALLPSAIPVILGIALAIVAATENRDEHQVHHTGYVPPAGSKFYAPILYLPDLDPRKMIPDKELEGQRATFMCNASSTWTWQKRRYDLSCADDAFDYNDFTVDDIKYVEHRGNDNYVFPLRPGIKIKFDKDQKLSGHNFEDKTYRFAGARHDPLRIRDAFMHRVWNKLDNNTKGLECTNMNIFTQSYYLGVYSMCSDRDEGQHQFEPHVSEGKKAEWIADVEPSFLQVERGPKQCEDVKPKHQEYPALPQCTAFHPFRDTLENKPESIENYANQFLMGEFVRDFDGYLASTFVYVTDADELRFGPQWDADNGFQYFNQGYKGWQYRTIKEMGSGSRKTRHFAMNSYRHQWMTQPSKQYANIAAALRTATSAGGALSKDFLNATLEELAAVARRDMHHDEKAWTRWYVDVTRYFMDFVSMQATTGVWNYYEWKSFSSEFKLMKDLALKRACWMQANVEDLRTNSGDGLTHIQGIGNFVAWACIVAGGIGVLYWFTLIAWMCAVKLWRACKKQSGASLSLYMPLQDFSNSKIQM